ncbi:putative RNase H-like HicB family nuclease [Hydrogenispora ethanolica]|jgi:predicted RNase H-like HicB family nuclease|uniref:Putative RNase H-like HicB family nuclease n=1 Tax=Hydrogenispora ethanolica TaxID=1082276 RepID=A0A4R1S4L7_HYDET|nr:type II toxin-antitoxin system HicB family antitoxin [Hydrogenispora ethanolica]TCL74233.1 putative RNase H-like HicB family nuclease [Hydrogenispora ethanolica]
MEKNLDYYLSLNYPFIVRKDKDGTFCIKYPDLPGCISCGDTLEEAVTMGEDAKVSWIEVALEKGMPIPEPSDMEDNTYTGNFRLRMPKTLHRDLAQRAAVEGVSMNQYCIYLLGKEFEREHPRQ